MTLIDTGDISMRNVVRMQLFLTFFCEDTLSFCFYLFIFMEIHLFLWALPVLKLPQTVEGYLKFPGCLVFPSETYRCSAFCIPLYKFFKRAQHFVTSFMFRAMC